MPNKQQMTFPIFVECKKHLPQLLFTVIVLYCSCSQLLAQNTTKDIVLKGTVISAETQKPIPHAEIFISGTTVGCISNTDGEFSLKVPFIPCTLVADHVSYESFVLPFTGKQKELNIELQTKLVSIEQVKVTGKNNRKKNLRYFYSHFIRKNRNRFKVLNDSVLYFKSDKEEFVAYSTEPLIILNKILGYKTKMTIERFRITRNETPFGPPLNLNSNYGTFNLELLAYYFYEDLKPGSLKEKLTYTQNRRLRYFGSERHFLKSVYHGTTFAQSFTLEVFPNNRNLKGFKKVENFETGQMGKNYIIDCDSICVTYKYGQNRYPYNYSLVDKSKMPLYETSTIYRSNKIFTLRENGTSSNISFTIRGPMTSTDNVVNILPMDYDPFQ